MASQRIRDMRALGAACGAITIGASITIRALGTKLASRTVFTVLEFPVLHVPAGATPKLLERGFKGSPIH
jgi:hypothetical protein